MPAKPVSYDQLYPGRFIKAGELLNRKATLTIKDIDLEKLEDEKGEKKEKAIVSFQETPKKLVLCKTNGICIKEMFGPVLADWIGKRVTIFPDMWEGKPAIRVWGSPDIDEDIDLTIKLPRKKPFPRTMRRVGPAKAAPLPPPPPPAEPEPADPFNNATETELKETA